MENDFKWWEDRVMKYLYDEFPELKNMQKKNNKDYIHRETVNQLINKFKDITILIDHKSNFLKINGNNLKPVMDYLYENKINFKHYKGTILLNKIDMNTIYKMVKK